jgi:hypothetical protein
VIGLGTCSGVAQLAAGEEVALEGTFPIIALGYGLIEVAEGRQDDLPALIFGRNGSGRVGESTQPERRHLPGETLAVVTFANVESLDVVMERLNMLRAKMAVPTDTQLETDRLLSSPANAAHLAHSIEQARNGEVQARELIEPDVDSEGGEV